MFLPTSVIRTRLRAKRASEWGQCQVGERLIRYESREVGVDGIAGWVMDLTDGFDMYSKSYIDSNIQVEREWTYREKQLSRFMQDMIPR